MKKSSPIVSFTLACMACTGGRESSVGDRAVSAPTLATPGPYTSPWSFAAGSVGMDSGRRALKHPSGDVLILGSFGGELVFGGQSLTTTHEFGASMLARIDSSSGAALWTRSFGDVSLLAADVGADGEILLLARSGMIDTALDGIAIPRDSNLVLTLSDQGEALNAIPVAPGMFPSLIRVSPGGDIFVSGHWRGVSTFDSGIIDAAPPNQGSVDNGFVARYTRDGQLLWNRDIATSGHDAVTAMQAKAEGVVLAGIFGGSESSSPSLVLDGQTFENPGRSGGFVASLDRDGQLQWGHMLGSPDDEYISDLAIGEDGSVLVAGSFRGTIVLPTGTATTTAPNGDGFVLELAEDGSPLSQAVVRSLTGTRVSSVAWGPQSIYLAGQCDGDFLRIDDDQLPCGMTDMFLAKLGPNRAPQWMRSFGGQEDISHENANDLVFLGDERIVLVGDFMGLNVPGRLEIGNSVLEGHKNSDIFVGLLELDTAVP